MFRSIACGGSESNETTEIWLEAWEAYDRLSKAIRPEDRLQKVLIEVLGSGALKSRVDTVVIEPDFLPVSALPPENAASWQEVLRFDEGRGHLGAEFWASPPRISSHVSHPWDWRLGIFVRLGPQVPMIKRSKNSRFYETPIQERIVAYGVRFSLFHINSLIRRVRIHDGHKAEEIRASLTHSSKRSGLHDQLGPLFSLAEHGKLHEKFGPIRSGLRAEIAREILTLANVSPATAGRRADELLAIDRKARNRALG